MGWREKLNENPKVTSGIMIGVIAIALFLIYWFQIRKPSLPPPPPIDPTATQGPVQRGRPGVGDQQQPPAGGAETTGGGEQTTPPAPNE